MILSISCLILMKCRRKTHIGTTRLRLLSTPDQSNSAPDSPPEVHIPVVSGFGCPTPPAFAAAGCRFRAGKVTVREIYLLFRRNQPCLFVNQPSYIDQPSPFLFAAECLARASTCLRS